MAEPSNAVLSPSAVDDALSVLARPDTEDSIGTTVRLY